MKRISAITVRDPAPWAERSAPLCRNRSDGEKSRHRGCLDCQTSLLTAVSVALATLEFAIDTPHSNYFAIILFLRAHPLARGTPRTRLAFPAPKTQRPFASLPSRAVIQA